MTRLARALWIVAAGHFLLLMGPVVDHEVKVRAATVSGLPLLSLIGLLIVGYGMVRVGAALVLSKH